MTFPSSRRDDRRRRRVTHVLGAQRARRARRPRRCVSGWKTSWTSPVRSRRSMKIRPPWSRRRCTQPATRTSSPTRVGASRPAPGCRGRRWRAAARITTYRPRRTCATTADALSTGSCSPLSMSLSSIALVAEDRQRSGPAAASACFSWPFTERPASSSCAGTPARRASAASANACGRRACERRRRATM